MFNKNAKAFTNQSEDNTILHDVRMAAIGHSMRGNIFGQFGRILTKEKKQTMKDTASKISAQDHINKLRNNWCPYSFHY